MALVKYGGGIIQMSGSVAGMTHARNRYGNYVRAKTKPVNPNSARQNTIRASMAAMTVRWSQTLTAVQRAAWNLYGSSVSMLNALGESVFLTGFNHYLRSNIVRDAHGLGIVDAGPVVFELPAHDPTFSISASEATQQITYAYDDTMAWADETGGWMILFQGSPQNPQRNFFDGPWRYATNVAGVTAAPPASPKIAGVPFAFAELQRQWVYARILRADGRISTPFRDDTFCAA